jgi:hypothetical protein
MQSIFFQSIQNNKSINRDLKKKRGQDTTLFYAAGS